MDARNTGALIAARRKALGMTQKQLAERLLISDKAVSKWENGASYPEVTLLPPLAQLLGITVDELLAGEVHGEQKQESEQTDAADTPENGGSPQDKPGSPPLEAFLTPQQYLADRQGSTDDKMLLAAVVCILAAMYCGSLFGQAAVLRNLVIVLIVYVAFRVWHSKQCDRFAALGMDTAVSCRRVRMADRLFGIVWVFELLVWWLVKRLSWLLLDYEAAKIGRYYIVFSAGDKHQQPSTLAAVLRDGIRAAVLRIGRSIFASLPAYEVGNALPSACGGAAAAALPDWCGRNWLESRTDCTLTNASIWRSAADHRRGRGNGAGNRCGRAKHLARCHPCNSGSGRSGAGGV